MSEKARSEQVELDNVALRAAMLRYNVITDGEDRYPLARALARCKVLIPVFRNREHPDGVPVFGTVYKHGSVIELYAYTSVELIPETCVTDGVMYYPLLSLTEEIIAEGEITYLRLDPGYDHAVGFLFKNGGFTMFRLKHIEDLIERQARKED